MSEHAPQERTAREIPEPAPNGLVVIRSFPNPLASEVALAVLQAAGIRGLVLRQPDQSAHLAVHARDVERAEHALRSAGQDAPPSA